MNPASEDRASAGRRTSAYPAICGPPRTNARDGSFRQCPYMKWRFLGRCLVSRVISRLPQVGMAPRPSGLPAYRRPPPRRGGRGSFRPKIPPAPARGRPFASRRQALQVNDMRRAKPYARVCERRTPGLWFADGASGGATRGYRPDRPRACGRVRGRRRKRAGGGFGNARRNHCVRAALRRVGSRRPRRLCSHRRGRRGPPTELPGAPREADRERHGQDCERHEPCGRGRERGSACGDWAEPGLPQGTHRGSSQLQVQ